MDSLRAMGERIHCRVEESISSAWLDASLLKDLPVDYLRSGPMLPVRIEGVLYVCTPNPGYESAFPELSVHLKDEAEPLLVPASEVKRAIDEVYAGAGSSEPETEETASVEAVPDHEGREDLLRQSESAPVAAKVNRLMLDGLRLGASDIHLEPVGARMQVRFRLDGVLYPQDEIPLSLQDALVSRIKIMARLDIAERRLPQDGNARVRVGDREVDIRVSSLPVADGERLVLRLLGRESTRLSLQELGMPERVLSGFRSLLAAPHGVIWVTGPTGSGKSTTLYAALQELDTKRQNILTIEDPVEYQMPGIGQMAVQPRIGLHFSTGLRALLRQDPDVILVGETRDEETAEIVVRASMTGHLVLSTLHANDSVSASLRLTDMGVEPFLVAEATQGAMAQRLVRRLCPHCAAEDSSPVLPEPLRTLKGVSLKKAVGCDQCREGYMGRKALFELLEMDGSLRELIRNQASVEAVRDAAQGAGFRDVWSAAGESLRDGVTSLKEVQSVLGRGV
jgi:general secretion pathway protein E